MTRALVTPLAAVALVGALSGVSCARHVSPAAPPLAGLPNRSPELAPVEPEWSQVLANSLASALSSPALPDDLGFRSSARMIREGGEDEAIGAVADLDGQLVVAGRRDRALAELRYALSHKSAAVRRAAALAIWGAEPEDREAREELSKAVGRGSLGDRLEVAQALARLKPLPGGVVDALRAAAREGEFTTKLLALRILEDLGTAAEAAAPDVERLLDSEGIAFRAYRTLRAIRAANAQDDVLAKHIWDLAPGVPHTSRIAALRAFAEREDAARPALWALLAQAKRYGPAEESAAVIDALSRVAPNDPRAYVGVVNRYHYAVSSWREGEASGWWDSRVRYFGDRNSLRDVTAATTDALARMKPPAGEGAAALLSLLDVLKDADTRETQAVSAAAHEKLRSFGEKGLPEIRRLLRDGEPAERLLAVHGLAVLAVDSPRAMEALGNAFANADPKVRLSAIGQAATLGPLGAPLVSKLATVAVNANTAEAGPAVDTLAAIGAASASALPALRNIATSPENNDWFRQRSAIAILKIAPEDPSATPLASWLLEKDRFPEVVEAAPRLAEPGKVVLPIAQLAARENAPAAPQAFDALAKLGPKAVDAIPTLAQLLDGADNTKRVAAARALGAIGPAARDAACPRLGRMTDNADPAVRRSAADALVAIDPASPHLASAYLAAVRRRDTSLVNTLAPHVRAIDGAAARIVPKLTHLAASDQETGVREVATQALRAIDR